MFALQKFHPYLLGLKVIVFFDHAALKALLQKDDFEPRLIKRVLLLQEFDIEIVDKPRAQNLIADYLSRLENGEKENSLSDQFLDESLYAATTNSLCCYVEIVDYLVTKELPTHLSRAKKEKIRAQLNTTYRMSPTYGNFTVIKLLNDA